MNQIDKEEVFKAQQRMEKFTHEFPDDILNSITIAKENPLQLKRDEIDNIIICGMGGSGIGGMIAKDILQDYITKPIEFIKGYKLPKYASKNTLVICSSYSGNTEETISLFEQAIDRKAEITVICSGGKLQKLARQHKTQILLITGGKQPRAAVGLSLVQQLHILSKIFLDSTQKSALFKMLLNTSEELKRNSVSIQKKANLIAKKLSEKKIFIYTVNQFASLGIRFSQQINENVKKKAHLGIIPEMSHNELVAFTDFTNEDAVITINSERFLTQNKKRSDFIKQELKKQNTHIIEIDENGSSTEENFLKTIYLLDLVSIELAKIKEVDPEEVNVINRLKSAIK